MVESKTGWDAGFEKALEVIVEKSKWNHQPHLSHLRITFLCTSIDIPRPLHLFVMRASGVLRMPIFKRSSYYDQEYRQSAALIRARRPYIFKNALVGTAIATFAIGVCQSHAHT